jgi:UDP:flavonoid glycosyltransferase YjiC (YdhE family)
VSGDQNRDLKAKGHNVAFVLFSEHSSYNAAFGLARLLRQRNHRPIFFTSEETVFAKYVATHGFEGAKVPAAPEPQAADDGKAGWFRFWERRKRARARHRQREQESFARLLAAYSIDLCFLDVIHYNVSSYALVLARMGVPAILLNPTFSAPFRANYPPVFASVIPSDTTAPGLRLKISYGLLWMWTLSTLGRARSYGRLEYVKWVIAFRFRNMVQSIGIEPELLRLGVSSTWSEYRRRPLLPEIVFGHRLLDWPATASDPDRCYFGTTDLFREVPDFDWTGIDADRPIVYCNVSTAHGFERIALARANESGTEPNLSQRKFRMAEHYLEVVLDCFSRREDWQLIAACGPLHQGLRARVHARNIHLFQRLPQLAVLARADLAITWGGAGTVRECMNFGVPMLVYPAWTDQFGNAARVFSRNVGIRGDILAMTAEEMTKSVERVLTDAAIRRSVAEIRARCNATDETEGLVDFVQRHTGLRL